MHSHNLIADLWTAEELPICDGVYRTDGSSRAVRVTPGSPGGLLLGEPIDLAAFIAADRENVTSIDVTALRDIPDKSGRLATGEGSWGSEGFVARLDNAGDLIWVLYLEFANPFRPAEISGSIASITSTSGTNFTLDLAAGVFGP